MITASRSTGSVEEIVARMGELAALPHVVFGVIEAANDPNAPAAAIERAVTVDPGFAARLLAEANSAAFANAANVASIREAVMRLGFSAVRNLALAVGTFDLFVGKSDAESLRRRGWWKRSVDAAMLAKWTAHHTRAARPDDAYTGALLHLVGKTVLDRCGGPPYTGVYAAMRQHGLTETEAERRVYGVHSGVVGRAAGEHWGFPSAIASAMNAVDAPSEPDPLRATVALAAWMASESGEPPHWALENLGVSAADLPTLLGEATLAIESARQRSG